MKLPKFLFDYVSKHQTSLGDNLAFPEEQDYPFDYKILKRRMVEVDSNAKELFGEEINPKNAQNLLVKELTKCQKIEEPIKEQLVKICENVVYKMFTVPKETIELNLKLVENLTPNRSIRILPEEFDEEHEWVFENLKEKSEVNKIILKRRFINALVQGASYRYGQLSDFYIDDFLKLNKELPQIYKKIIVLNDYLLFNKKENISDKNPKQGAIVEVELGREGEKTCISSQATNFIFLLTETIRGFFELFASHGLPSDNKKANYIISQSDFLLAEPWDLRMGVKLWDMLTIDVDNTKLMPYYFTDLCKLPVDDFNDVVREILAKTKQGENYKKNLIDDSEKEYEMMNIDLFIQDKNNNETLINDSYFTPDELGYGEEEMLEEEFFTEDELTEPKENYNDEDELVDKIVNASWDQIDFEENEINIPRIGSNNKHLWEMKIIANGTEIPVKLVSLWAESVPIGNRFFYQLHIRVDEKLRRKGIAFKLYKSFINIFGQAISLYQNRTATYYKDKNSSTSDDVAIEKLWGKLATDPTIKVQTVKKHGEPIGVVGFKK